MCQPVEKYHYNLSTLCSFLTMPFFSNGGNRKAYCSKAHPRSASVRTRFQHFLAATVSRGAQDQGQGTEHWSHFYSQLKTLAGRMALFRSYLRRTGKRSISITSVLNQLKCVMYMGSFLRYVYDRRANRGNIFSRGGDICVVSLRLKHTDVCQSSSPSICSQTLFNINVQKGCNRSKYFGRKQIQFAVRADSFYFAWAGPDERNAD